MRLRADEDTALLTGIFGTFATQFPIEADRPYALKDKELPGVIFCCMNGRGESFVDEKNKPFAEKIPQSAPKAREQYERLRLDPFFERFGLFLTKEGEGMIVAFGVDEFYYVLATWDPDGEHVWVPEFNDKHKLVIKH